MSEKTKIEWTDSTWNPIYGCSPISEGCRNCYAMAYFRRWKKPTEPRLNLMKLDEPKRWKRPRRVFVCSLADLFHQDVADDWLDQVYQMMVSGAPHHTYQVLTKRPERMAAYLGGAESYIGSIGSHIWHGVTIENQVNDWRLHSLKKIPSAMRFLSCEPLLGPLELDLTGIGWVIAGGENGANRRPMLYRWVAALRDQCRDAGIPFFFKGWSARSAGAAGREIDGREWLEVPAQPAPVHPKWSEAELLDKCNWEHGHRTPEDPE